MRGFDVVTGAVKSFIQPGKRFLGRLDMSEYKHGSMDITAQEQTFAGFIKFLVRAIIVIAAVLIFLAIFGA